MEYVRTYEKGAVLVTGPRGEGHREQLDGYAFIAHRSIRTTWMAYENWTFRTTFRLVRRMSG